ncbi:hypothetical protein GJ698_15030 [Pseudoduganella sp. FT26W]|uniref:RelA/SpoT domain-containing protein n=1 Tax=Duganella aquatilis TaxID=2666082 RepID=A0A844CZU9_9BURK|nr:hypothetical protein [Duganella aquatilis]MRW85398.1 hypothetical protein [Duganella aquatilis]
MTATSEQLKIQHQDNANRAERLRDAVVVQLQALLDKHELTLGVPIESRVKTWASIEEKLQRKGAKLENIFSLEDLIGVRVIFLFRSDLDLAIKMVTDHFEIHSAEDTSDRLGESEFGYQSQHFVVRLPSQWLSLPSLTGLGDFVIELQLRTLAQHIWAAASHKLQYKQETGVPPPLRRAITRVSALLEIVDLEFERVLEERRKYVEENQANASDDEPLNVDNIASILASLLPANNRKDGEHYADLLPDLIAFKVDTRKKLTEIITRHKSKIMQSDSEHLARRKRENEPVTERDARGVFFAHIGLAREALRMEFGSKKVSDVMARNRKS